MNIFPKPHVAVLLSAIKFKGQILQQLNGFLLKDETSQGPAFQSYFLLGHYHPDHI